MFRTMFSKLQMADRGFFDFIKTVNWVIVALSGLAGLVVMFALYDFFLGFLLACMIVCGSLMVVFALLLNLYIAGHFYFIAVDKGYSDRIYLRLAFFLGFVIYLMIAAMPDRGGKPAEPTKVVHDNLPDL